jgi:hypothetical protein
MKTFLARTPYQWRRWLVTHHDSESEVWLVFYKAHTGRRSIAYSDAIDEALCFGWVDSLVKRLDNARYALKFTPRKADSQGFFVTPYGQGRWVSVWADGGLNWGLVGRLLEQSYRMVALKRMIAALDGTK